MRVKRGRTRHKRHKKILKQASGFRGSRSKLIRPARLALERSLKFAYRDRRQRKRQFRRLWVARINAAAREHGLSYASFIHGLSEAGVELAIKEPAAFAELVALAKSKAA
jgi:large subunit ribosomal protein L20